MTLNLTNIPYSGYIIIFIIIVSYLVAHYMYIKYKQNRCSKCGSKSIVKNMILLHTKGPYNTKYKLHIKCKICKNIDKYYK